MKHLKPNKKKNGWVRCLNAKQLYFSKRYQCLSGQKNPNKQTKNMSFKIPYKIKRELYGKLSCKKKGT